MANAHDGYTLTVQELLRKCGELHGEIAALRAQADVKLRELEQCAAAAKVLNPDIDPGDLPERPAPPPSAAFRGEVARFLLSHLRGADGPLPTSRIAEAVMDARGLPKGDRVLSKLIRNRTGHSLGSLRRKGLVESRRYGHGAELDWWVSDRGTRDGGGLLLRE